MLGGFVMKLSKGMGVSLCSALALFGIFNVAAFLLPLTHTVSFWLGYFFALFALAAMVLTLAMYFGKPVKEDKFLALPSVKVAWIYFVFQTGLSVWEMIAFPFTYTVALIANLVLGVIFSILILALFASAEKIDKSEQFTAEKVLFIKQLKLKVESLDVDDAELNKKLKELSEDIRFSDPMSHSKLEDIETELMASVDELEENISDVDKAKALCVQVAKLLKKRNDQCKILKGVKDEKSAVKTGSGKNFAFAGVAIAIAVFLVALATYFFLVPQTQYKTAMDLFEDKKYEEAIAVFEVLGSYRDSEEQIENVKNAIKQELYDAALALVNEGKYEEAIVAFTEIKDFSDSAQKIVEAENAIKQPLYDAALLLMNEGKYEEAIAAFTEIKDFSDSAQKIVEAENAIKQSQYDTAEGYFNSGKYSEAINIYSELGEFKESKLRIEQIYNRLSEGDIIYFGTYNSKPIAWKIIKTETDKKLLLAEEPIAQKPFTDEIKKVTWETSSLRTWLNEEFIQSFSSEQQNQILETNTGKEKDKVFLLSVDEMEALSYTVLFKTSDEWWTRTATDDGIMYTSPTGWVIASGDQVVRDKGVRPSIWISLK